MGLDFVLRDARIAGRDGDSVDIGIASGRIAAIASGLVCDAPEERLDGRLAVPGFVDTHIHLDKSCILGRCQCRLGTLQEAISETAAAKAAFTEEDVYTRAATTLEKAIKHGTTRMRTHVEIDPRIGLRSFRAIQKLKRDYAWAIDIEICVFPQEGLTNDPGAEDLLIAACADGADVVGGCPYTDTDPNEQIGRIFAIARRFDIDIDFHLDFDIDPAWMHLDEVIRQTEASGWGGRVAVGHVTKLSAVSPDRLKSLAARLADAAVAVTVLPATDLFLMGRGHDRNVPRGVAPAHRLLELGVTCSLATNNVLNPFTPFGDCSLLRLANLYANIAQLGRPADLESCLDMVTRLPARLMNTGDYGIEVGRPADLIVLDAHERAGAVAEIAPVLFGLKRGRRTFSRPAALLHRPELCARIY